MTLTALCTVFGCFFMSVGTLGLICWVTNKELDETVFFVASWFLMIVYLGLFFGEW